MCTCRSLCMAAGEALLLAALHQASTMALLTCFWPAHTNTLHHNVKTKLWPAGNEQSQQGHVAYVNTCLI